MSGDSVTKVYNLRHLDTFVWALEHGNDGEFTFVNFIEPKFLKERELTLRKTLFILILICSCSLFLVAQDQPKAEVFGGYQWTNVDGGSGVDRENFNGWNAALTGYFDNNFGITADFAGAYKNISGVDLKLHSFMFGPTYRFPGEKATGFVHALFGGAHATGSAFGVSASENGFAYALGGGVDLNAGKNFAIRVGQFDYLGTRLGGENQKNFRYSAGVVFKF